MNSEIERNKEVVLSFFARVSDEDDPNNVESAMALFSEEAVFRVMGSYGMGGCSDKAETTRKNIEALQVVKGRMKFRIHSITADGNRVAVEAENVCTLINEERYDNFYVFLFIMRHGKIWRVNEYLDTYYLYNAYQRLREHPAISHRVERTESAGVDGVDAGDDYFAHPVRSF